MGIGDWVKSPLNILKLKLIKNNFKINIQNKNK